MKIIVTIMLTTFCLFGFSQTSETITLNKSEIYSLEDRTFESKDYYLTINFYGSVYHIKQSYLIEKGFLNSYGSINSSLSKEDQTSILKEGDDLFASEYGQLYDNYVSDKKSKEEQDNRVKNKIRIKEGQL